MGACGTPFLPAPKRTSSARPRKTFDTDLAHDTLAAEEMAVGEALDMSGAGMPPGACDGRLGRRGAASNNRNSLYT